MVQFAGTMGIKHAGNHTPGLMFVEVLPVRLEKAATPVRVETNTNW